MTSQEADSNPYHPGDASRVAPRTRATRWMIWAGAFSLLIAVLCVIATVLWMVWSFEILATAPSAPKPSDLANDVKNVLILFLVAGAIALVGVMLLILGFVRRRQIT